ncbi:MAG TPA: tRNA epoxyqueuosine(34) reductase QueG [Steroidobacteraceae bacterium]|nr:tRNA epoxyqueuosine(34) reductase QueG [Steroidobacteraceae bacterium]
MSGLTQFAPPELPLLRPQLQQLARELGFDALGVAELDLAQDEQHLLRWLDEGRHGDMQYMARHGLMRSRPATLAPGSVRAICVRMNYFPADAADAATVLTDPQRAYLSRYALGRDYHKVMRGRLKALARRVLECIGPFGYRVCVDSAPVLEKALARNAGLGWIGKHTNLLSRDAGSWFFLGEILTDLPLPADSATSAHCGSCTACIDVCPTQAILGPRQLDARRCVSYLTIEHHGAIPPEFRQAMGNRIYGCDDCQLVCPWNKYAQAAAHPDFRVRHGLDRPRLTELFAWTQAQFEERMRGSAIYRIGYERWSRNIAVALGNAPSSAQVRASLLQRRADASELLREHIDWALARHPA